MNSQGAPIIYSRSEMLVWISLWVFNRVLLLKLRINCIKTDINKINTSILIVKEFIKVTFSIINFISMIEISKIMAIWWFSVRKEQYLQFIFYNFLFKTENTPAKKINKIKSKLCTPSSLFKYRIFSQHR